MELAAAGFTTKAGSDDECAERLVRGLIRTDDANWTVSQIKRQWSLLGDVCLWAASVDRNENGGDRQGLDQGGLTMDVTVATWAIAFVGLGLCGIAEPRRS